MEVKPADARTRELQVQVIKESLTTSQMSGQQNHLLILSKVQLAQGYSGS